MGACLVGTNRRGVAVCALESPRFLRVRNLGEALMASRALDARVCGFDQNLGLLVALGAIQSLSAQREREQQQDDDRPRNQLPLRISIR